MNTRATLAVLSVVVLAASLLIHFSGQPSQNELRIESPEPSAPAESSSPSSMSPTSPSRSNAVDAAHGDGGATRAEDSRPELFSGSREARSFLRDYWGPKWPTVEQWALQNDVPLPEGVWNFDEQLLPSEARAVIEAKIADRIQGAGDLESHIAGEIGKLTRTPLDDALRRHRGGPIELPARGGDTVSIEPESLAKFEAHLSVGKQRANEIARQIVEDGIRTALEDLAQGKTSVVPLLEYIEGTDPFGKSNSEWLFTSSYGMWIGRLKVDLEQSGRYELLRSRLDAELQSLRDFYWEVVELYR